MVLESFIFLILGLSKYTLTYKWIGGKVWLN
jgi:hypothetical protein